MNDDLLREQFHALAGSPPAGPEDREEIVVGRARGIQRRRRAAGTVAAAVVLLGRAAIWQSVRPMGHEDVVTPASGHGLLLRVGLPVHAKVKTGVPLTAHLTGRGTADTRYGWIIRWGDGSLDRAYGSNCPSNVGAPVDDSRSYVHSYARPGTYAVQVVVTRCAVQQVTKTATVVVSSH